MLIVLPYLMYRPDKSLTEVSEKRLKLSKFTELGSGFQIAMRDLSIRGQVSFRKFSVRFIDSVELYSQLLEEAIAENGTDKKHWKNAELILQIDAYLPDEYVQMVT